jgi:hypothetical protein
VESKNLPQADDRCPRAREDAAMTTEPTNINGASNLRASDADREEMAALLRRNHSEGRLDSEEFAARIDRCYDAKTIGELQDLVVDLPSAPVRDVRASVQRVGMLRAVWLLPLLFGAVAVVAHSGVWMLFPLLFIARGCWRGRSRCTGYGAEERVL